MAKELWWVQKDGFFGPAFISYDAYAASCINTLELGLRWLHDRTRDSSAAIWAFEKGYALCEYDNAPLALELGLRWLHDRVAEGYTWQCGYCSGIFKSRIHLLKKMCPVCGAWVALNYTAHLR